MMKEIIPSQSQLLGYKCMFFDFDGVVLESGDIKTEAFVELFNGLGIEDEVKEHHLANQGVSRYDKFRWITENLLEREYNPSIEEELGARFASIVKQKVIESPFVEGFEAMIQAVRDAKIYCVVASGTPHEELNSIIRSRSIDSWFDEVYGSPRKKDEIVKMVLADKGFKKTECLFFGDASTDFEAAEQVGIDFFARLTDELAPYWEQVTYTFGKRNFSQLF
ncbi:HAD family hydrolase [Roseivirga sp.]|uniref:HAD family hydrolase n=1 Tax=Roseivirga sp. TaxID=1964215 RepID=UPI003B519AB1